MNFVEHQVVEFKRKNHLRKVTLKNLVEVCHKKGYIVKSYSTSKLIFATLNLWNKAKNSDSLSVVDSNGNIIIFLRDTFSDEKKLYALAHELGHITLKHEDHSEYYAENEADQFAHYLLSENVNQKLNIAIGIIFLFLCACILLLITFTAPYDNEQVKTVSVAIEGTTENEKMKLKDDTVCYFSRYGTVYHIYKDCYYLKDSEQIYTNTIDECHLDRLCSACERR